MEAENLPNAPYEERASCLFVRRVLDEQRKASACFSAVASPYPPPPPPSNLKDRHAALREYENRLNLGEQDRYAAPRATDEDQYNADFSAAIERSRAMISQLGETNPVLRTLLQGAVSELLESSATSGRRLMQRPEYQTMVTEVLSTHPIMTAYGKDGIPGVTRGSCAALCEAVTQDDNVTDTSTCRAYGFRRSDPFSKTQFGGFCYLLQNAGACRPADFGTELYLRQIDSENICSQVTPGLDNPLCLGLPATREDARVLTHSDAAAIAAQVPDKLNPAPGAGGLPNPRSTLEAMSMIAFARQYVRCFALIRTHSFVCSVPQSRIPKHGRESLPFGPPLPTRRTGQ